MNTARNTELKIHMDVHPDSQHWVLDLDIVFSQGYLRVESRGKVIAEDKIDPASADMITDILDDWVTDKTIK